MTKAREGAYIRLTRFCGAFHVEPHPRRPFGRCRDPRHRPGPLPAGERPVDTAQIYGNEQDVGAALAATGVARGEIFVTTKVWIDKFAEGDLQRSVDESLKKLRVDQVLAQ